MTTYTLHPIELAHRNLLRHRMGKACGYFSQIVKSGETAILICNNYMEDK